MKCFDKGTVFVREVPFVTFQRSVEFLRPVMRQFRSIVDDGVGEHAGEEYSLFLWGKFFGFEYPPVS